MINIPSSKFIDNLLTVNQIDKASIDQWLFYPGMLFQSPESWWGAGKNRHSRHEGMDICYYLDMASQINAIPVLSRIPAMYNGFIRKISNDDFLGQSIYMQHPQYSNNSGFVLNTIYAHTSPINGLKEGDYLKSGDVVAQLIDFDKVGAKMFRHVHLSMALVSNQLSRSLLKWENMHKLQDIQLINPLNHIECPYLVQEYVPWSGKSLK